MSGAEIAVPLFASVIGAGATLASSAEQRSMARKAEKARQDSQNKLEQERAKQEAQAKLDQNRNVEKAKKQAKASVAGGRSDTILTSPIGIVGAEQQAAAKTLLGG